MEIYQIEYFFNGQAGVHVWSTMACNSYHARELFEATPLVTIGNAGNRAVIKFIRKIAAPNSLVLATDDAPEDPHDAAEKAEEIRLDWAQR